MPNNSQTGTLAEPPTIVLITVNDHETNALLDAFLGEDSIPRQIPKGKITYNDLGIHGGHQIVHSVCEMGTSGIGASQQRAGQAIAHWQPSAVIAVGIAFGLDETKQKIGDVLVSKQIQDYELGRLNDDGTLIPRGDKPSSADSLINRLRLTDATEQRRKGDWPKVRFGLVLSGQKLVDNLDYRESLKKLHPESIGGEMEAVGLYTSASEDKVDWIVVKAICDWGHNKNHPEKEAWQKLAARNAARVLKKSIDVGCLYQTENSSANNPGKASTRAPQGAKRNRQAKPVAKTPATVKTDISRIDKYAPAELIGREDELAMLNAAWAKVQGGEAGRPHVLTIVAMGGEGKTSLVAKWMAALAGRDWPGCEAAFAWSFYSQGTRDQNAASSDTFLKEALLFFGDPEMAASNAGSFEKGKRLAQLVGERRALLVLDGLEPLQYAPSSPTHGQLKDQGVTALLKTLAASNRGLCLVTSRYSLPDLKTYRQTTAPEEKLARLSPKAGIELLKQLGVTGAKSEFEKQVEDVDGHALTLQIMGGFLKKAYHGDIRCRDRVKFIKADAKVQGGHAFRAMAAYEQWLSDGSEESRRELTILRLMGFFDRPATEGCLTAMLQPPAIAGLTEPLLGLAEEDWNCSLDGLAGANLLTVNRDGAGRLLALDAHPLLREYFATRLKEQLPEAWREGHRRIYRHLCDTTEDKPEPTLEELQPLYQAVSHGCQAGLQQEACDRVLDARIMRGTGNAGLYSTRELGALASDLGAMACFFDTPWQRISPSLSEGDQAWLLGMAAFTLRGLGRLGEALEPMRAGLEMCVKQEDWRNAAISNSNLSELELTLGQVAEAVTDGEQCVILAGQNGDALLRIGTRITEADALHQAGWRNKALALFCEAEAIQTEAQPQYPLLYSMQGFRYCDLLLAEAEQEAGKRGLHGGGTKERKEAMQACWTVCQRAETALQIVLKGRRTLLEIALNHLTLGRVALYGALLDPATDQRAATHQHLNTAVATLRRAGTQDHLPRGLLSRAWLRAVSGQLTGPESAQADLDEAWELAERGPMRLFLADIHLYRARLFFREADYPWESPEDDLAEARKLIESCGYWRRKEELEDAEKVIFNISGPSEPPA